MLKMLDLPFPPIGAPPVEYLCPEEVQLDDSAFSNKEPKVAAVGDKLRLSHHENYGAVKHPIHGLFRC